MSAVTVLVDLDPQVVATLPGARRCTTPPPGSSPRCEAAVALPSS